MLAEQVERPILPLFSLVDIRHRLLIHRNGRLTLVYRVTAFHEPALDDPEFEHLALQLTHTWSALPEGVSYQFLTVVDAGAAANVLTHLFRPVPPNSERHELYEAIREENLKRFTSLALGNDAGRELLQARQHYLCVSFEPEGLKKHRRARIPFVRARRQERLRTAFDQALSEADVLDRSTTRALMDLGVGYDRCDDDALARLMHQLLSPDTSQHQPLEGLGERLRDDHHDLPESILQVHPFLADASPLWELTDDPLTIDRRYLRLGSWYVAVVTMKKLPDATYAGSLVPLLRLPIPRYTVSFRVNILDQAAEIAALAKASKMADAWKQASLFGSSKREDPAVASLQRQKDEALRKAYETSQRLVGVSLSLTILARSAEELDGHVRSALGAMAMARGLAGVREDYALLQAFAASLPGGPELPHALQKCESPVASDLVPVYDFREGEGRIPFPTPNSSIVLFDHWSPTNPSPHQLIFASTGWGKSYAMQYQLACAEAHYLARGETPPRLFFLDKGGSYRRFLEVRGADALYIPFSPDSPPGIDIFRHSADEEPLETHVSRLTWLLLDFLRLSEADAGPAAFEARKAAVQQALFRVYEAGAASFASLEAELTRLGHGELAQALYPYQHGSLAALFVDNPRLVLAPHINAVCWDLFRLNEHPDMKRVALRLAVYQIRKLAYAAARRRQTTYLVIDEAWDFLSGNLGIEFVIDALRTGRKDGLAVICLSQQLEDFAHPAFRAAILGNAGSRLIGHPGKVNMQSFRELLNLNDRQIDMIQRLKAAADYREFLLVTNDRSEVVRVPANPLIEKLFTTRHEDVAQWARLTAAGGGATLLHALRAWAGIARA